MDIAGLSVSMSQVKTMGQIGIAVQFQSAP